MNSFARILTALVVEGTAAGVLGALLLFAPSGAETPASNAADTASAFPLMPIQAADAGRPGFAQNYAVANDIAGNEAARSDGDRNDVTRNDVALRLDRAAIGLRESLEREVDRILEPFTHPAPAAPQSE
jgi:hypothetical protein